MITWTAPNSTFSSITLCFDSLTDSRRDGFIPIGDAFDALKVRILDRDMDETPTDKALRLKKARDNYIK